MEIVRKLNRMRSLARQGRREGKTIGLVSTMGCFHEGHLSLMRRSREMADVTVVSILVNPTQFGPDEDYEKYPRDIVRDAELASHEGVDYLFVPEVEEMYPQPFYAYVNVSSLSKVLCGARSAGHFRGVATVVMKFLHIVAPHFAFFGFKDAQQSILIETMVRDLNMDVEMVVCPTVREADGLAMGSRNMYLSKEERQSATSLYRALQAAEELFREGEQDTSVLRDKMREVMEAAPHTRVDYAEISHPRTLEALERVDHEALASVAAFVGSTRLVDNLFLKTPEV
jgi:pantoate--beta-alanine ligase